MDESREYLLPELGEGLIDVELTHWRVGVGDRVEEGAVLAEVMSDKASMDVPAPFCGVITLLHGEAGCRMKVGESFVSYAPSKKTGGTPVPPEKNHTPLPSGTGVPPVSHPKPAHFPKPPAAPSVRRMARELDVDLTKVKGTGPDGRILVGDLAREAAKRMAPTSSPSPGPSAASRGRVEANFGTPGETWPMAGIRSAISKRMLESKRTIPHYSYVDECEVTRVVQLREMLKESAARRGVKLTYLAFIVLAACRAMRQVPIVNSSYDEPRKEIKLHERYDIGIATATASGLIVPVIRNVQSLDLLTVAAELDRIARQAKEGKTRREDLGGGTFTVSSIGGIGGLISTPIINPPEVAILAIGKIVRRPIYGDGDRLRPADMVYLSFSFDHRVIDGAVGAVFGNCIKDLLQQPGELLLPPVNHGS